MKKYNATKHHRRSIRLDGYDYTQPGPYFVTLCVNLGECLLGQLVGGVMRLSVPGQIAAKSWVWLEVQYPYAILDTWVVMPNHLHGIIGIGGAVGRGASRCTPTLIPLLTKPKPLGSLIGAFKTVSTKHINRFRGTPGERFWQRNYYEHIIRNERELTAIRQYIRDNPTHWVEDSENPQHVGKDQI